MVSADERAAAKVFHKGGWAGAIPTALDSPPKVERDKVPSPVGLRGGWPIAGGYSRDGGSWFMDSPPRERPRGEGYAWQHQQFVRPAA